MSLLCVCVRGAAGQGAEKIGRTSTTFLQSKREGEKIKNQKDWLTHALRCSNTPILKTPEND